MFAFGADQMRLKGRVHTHKTAKQKGGDQPPERTKRIGDKTCSQCRSPFAGGFVLADLSWEVEALIGVA